jgi:hypothetical protein
LACEQSIISREAGAGEFLARRLDAGRVEIRRLAAAQDDVAVLVAGGVHDGRMPALGHRKEMVRGRRRMNRIDRDADVAVGSVLEAHRAGESRGEFAVHLALGRPRADRAPCDEIGDVLRRDHVEVFGSGGQLEVVDLEQDSPRESQAFVDAEAVVEPGIVDEAFPADGRARLLEVDAHDDDQVARELAPEHGEPVGIIDCRVVVMDRARADDHEQPVVRAVKHAVDRLPSVVRRARGRRRDRKLAQQMRGRRQLHDVLDPGVVDRQGRGRVRCGGGPIALGSGVGHGGTPGRFLSKKQYITV